MHGHRRITGHFLMLSTYPVPVEVDAGLKQLLAHRRDIPKPIRSGNVVGVCEAAYVSVHWAGSTPRSIAAFSAGSPNASHPIGWITLYLEMGLGKIRKYC